MVDIQTIRDNLEAIKSNAEKRRVSVDLERLLAVDEERRTLITALEEKRAQRNKGSKGKPTEEEIAAMRALGDEIKAAEAALAAVDGEYHTLMMQVPNMTHEAVPTGGEEDFVTLETVGEPTTGEELKDHETLMIERDWIDFERAAKVSGSKFYFVKNDAVRLNQALLNYGLDILLKHGFTLMETPDLAKQDVIEGLGFQPRGEETQIYSVEGTDLSLIGTAEITLGGYHMNEIIDLSTGPKKYAAISHCFRTEAGSYGRTSKGLYRVHQFTKLEMFVYCTPEQSDALHNELLAIEKEIADGLELSYRVIDVASADLGAPAYRKFDIEAWMVMNSDYGEITSTSNCTDFQARRLNIRYKDAAGNNQYVHTLNGTAIVTSRFPVALIEQHQQPDGTVRIPAALQPYLGTDRL